MAGIITTMSNLGNQLLNNNNNTNQNNNVRNTAQNNETNMDEIFSENLRPYEILGDKQDDENNVQYNGKELVLRYLLANAIKPDILLKYPNIPKNVNQLFMSKYLGTNHSIINRILHDQLKLKSGELQSITTGSLNHTTISDNNFINKPDLEFKKSIKNFNQNGGFIITLNDEIKNTINNDDHYKIIQTDDNNCNTN